MTVDTIMTKYVVRVNMDDPVSVIQFKLQQGHFHHLLVVEGDELVGVISDRDLLRALSPFLGTDSELKRDLNTLNRRAHQVMSRKLITVCRTTLISEAARQLLDHHVSCLPVVDENGAIEGIVTWKDLLKHYAGSV